MRAVSDNGIALIKQFEGFSPRLYVCPAGYPTIGYGHCVRAGERFDQGIDEATAQSLLRADIAQAQRAVLRLISIPLSDGQYDALVSFTYNMGAGALQRSALRQCVNREDHAAVSAQLMRWIWARGRKQKGLIARRKAEAERYSQTS